jgi:hypothetical protein
MRRHMKRRGNCLYGLFIHFDIQSLNKKKESFFIQRGKAYIATHLLFFFCFLENSKRCQISFIKNLAEYLPLTRQDECVHHVVLLALIVDRFVTVR